MSASGSDTDSLRSVDDDAAEPVSKSHPHPAIRVDRLPDMITARVYHSVCVVGKNIYVFGGCELDGKAIDSVECYKSTKGRWFAEEKMPRMRAGAQAMAYKCYIFVVGGVDENQQTLSDIDRYDMTEKKWSTNCSLPVAVVGCASVVIHDRIYVLGGATTDNKSQSMFGYINPESNTWSDLPPMLTPRYSLNLFHYNNVLYAISGRDVIKPMIEVEAYDLSTHTWSSLPPIPSRRTYTCTLMIEKYIYHIGGVSEGVGTWRPNVRKLVEVLNVEDKVWSKLKAVKSKRTDFTAGVIEGSIVIAGGVSEKNDQLIPINETEVYVSSDDKWHYSTPLLQPRCSATYKNYESGFIILGGMSNGGPQKVVEYVGPNV